MINQAINHWRALQPYRNERLRCKNYTYGRQYLDYVSDNNVRMTEERYIRLQGNVPLKNNLIRRIVRNVLGVFRYNMKFPTPESLGLSESDPDDMWIARKLEESRLDENLKEVYARMMEEYLIGGMVAVRKRVRQSVGTLSGNRHGDLLVHTDCVRPDSFFFNIDSSDPRGRDISAIGEIHSVPLALAVTTFCRTPDDADRIGAYADSTGAETGEPTVRVVEYWRKEVRNYWLWHDRQDGRVYRSEERPGGEAADCVWQSELVWRYYFLAPDGTVLREGDSPYGEAGHPYVMRAYPFIDGEIHSFVADCIDQQRYINRLITLNDWILRSSAKGVLLFPEGSLPDNVRADDVADQWARFNGVITYRPQEGVPAPHQVSHNSTGIGISELLSVQLKMMEDVSGVNSALRGQLSSGAVSGTLYELQTRQALTGLADIIEGFENFMRDSALKEVALLREQLRRLKS